jgi:hypothetical protein
MRSTVLACSALLVLLGAGPDPGGEDPKVDYTRDVRPILANSCLLCHGPDPSARKGELRLDTREGALADLGGHAAVVPGKPEQSELLKRIASKDRDELMPPPKHGKRLSDRDAGILKRWIEQGAPYQRHWAFVKPARPAVPPGSGTEIDRFIAQRLEREKLAMSPEADRSALVRRVTLDLTGLPPTPEEADAFVADGAYEKLVDRLLASPAYGERWAKLWLDLARYADSQGYAEDRPRVIWAFRDWLIRALNADLPFDQFTLQIMAGDLLPDAGEDAVHATAFHRNTLTNTEGGTDDEEFRNAAVVDRVNTVLQAWMGLSASCAQCHNHKFDPFSQEEYFRVFAIFNQTEDSDRGDDYPTVAIWTDELKKRRAELEAAVSKAEAELSKETPERAAAREAWLRGFAAPPAWVPFGEAKKAAAFRLEGSMKTAAVGVRTGPGKSAAGRFVRVELPGKGVYLSLAEVQVFVGAENVALKGKAKQSSTAFEGAAKLAIDGNTNGDYHASKSVTHTDANDDPWWEVDLGRTLPVERVALWNRTDGGDGIMLRLKGARVKLLDEKRQVVEQRGFPDYPKPSAEWSLDGVKESDAVAAVVKPGELWVAPAAPLSGELVVRAEGAPKVWTTEDPRAPLLVKAPAEIRALLAKASWTPEESAKLAAWHRESAPELEGSRKALADAKKALADLKPAGTLPVLKELPPGKRRTTQIQERGNFLVKGKVVTPGVPVEIAPGAPTDRLGFGRWLLDPENPLTARVAVNRYWEQFFGIGLMSTSEDWGLRGETPSHPELLDWLAVEFRESGWKVKALLKRIVMSAAYRQSSVTKPEHLERDPANRLLARGPRLRLLAETVRDQALFVSGLLSRKIGGPSVYPPQPKLGLSAAFSTSTDWEASKGEDRYRRGMYTFWRRSVTYPSMATFDAPDRNVCTVRRVPTNTPLQALVTLNDPVYVEAAQALARRIVSEGGATPEQRAAWGVRRTATRTASAPEVSRLTRLYADMKARYQKDAAKAKSMATDPLGPLPEGADAAELAAWTVVGNVLLNLDEMFMKR